MLYDPKWEQQTKVDPFQLASLISWLEQKSPGAAYDYDCNGGCLLALYFQAHGYTKASMGAFTFWWVNRDKKILWEEIPKPFNGIAYASPRTFGGALERARAAQSNQSQAS